MPESDVAPVESAGPDDITFLDNPRYVESFARTAAGACIVAEKFADRAPAGVAVLLSQQPYQAFARVAQAFYPQSAPSGDVHPAAVVDRAAKVGDRCEIGPNAVIGAGARLGTGCVVGPNAVVGENVEIGDDCLIGATASLE